MGNPVKQYCFVLVKEGGLLDHITTHDAETGDVLNTEALILERNDEWLRIMAEKRTGKTCLKVARESGTTTSDGG